MEKKGDLINQLAIISDLIEKINLDTKSSYHRRRLKNLNLNEDIKYCLTPNQTNVIPILKNGKLVVS